MTERSLTIDRVRSARDSVYAHLAREMCELGADPTTLAQEAVSLDGIDWLERWVRPEIPPPPPIAVLFGAEWVQIEPSRVTLAFEPAEWMFNPFGAVYGGVTATAIDILLGAALHTTLPAGSGYATNDLHVRFVRALTAETGRVLATGTVVHAGRRHATVEGVVEAAATGKLIATATAAFTVLRASDESAQE
ncbi:MAG TPA: PaaI family thioesterase [Thermoleophilaceae bacterium]|nr:PaaI family thioesterase [Thermoleophilaceae bacterium]